VNRFAQQFKTLRHINPAPPNPRFDATPQLHEFDLAVPCSQAAGKKHFAPWNTFFP
jgi:hypothetical protein